MPYFGQPGREQWRTPTARPQRPARLTPWPGLMFCASRMWSPLPRQPIKKGGGGLSRTELGKDPAASNERRGSRSGGHTTGQQDAAQREGPPSLRVSNLAPHVRVAVWRLAFSLRPASIAMRCHCGPRRLACLVRVRPLGIASCRAALCRHPPLKGRGPPPRRRLRGTGLLTATLAMARLLRVSKTRLGRTTTPGRRMTSAAMPLIRGTRFAPNVTA